MSLKHGQPRAKAAYTLREGMKQEEGEIGLETHCCPHYKQTLNPFNLAWRAAALTTVAYKCTCSPVISVNICT